jgi:hypothetical protein
MKLKEGFILQQVGDEYMAVATGEAAKGFNGLIRNNKTANDILRLLMTDTTEEKVIDAMLERYDAPREVIAEDVHETIRRLREAGFIDG